MGAAAWNPLNLGLLLAAWYPPGGLRTEKTLLVPARVCSSAVAHGEALSTVDATSPARVDESSAHEDGPDPVEELQEPVLDVGHLAGEFALDGVIGHGSFGTVYRAAHRVIGRRAAVKVLRRSAAEAHAIASFIEEARLVSRLRHPHIVDVLTFGQLEDGRHFQVMDLIEGPTLADFLRERGAIPLLEALPIVRGVASALDAVHRSGITHRDLKPANVVLETREGALFPKLIDFGVAQLSLQDAEPDRALIGTPRYMAPEQCRGRRVDARADSYAFGLLLYEVLTGKPPFSGDEALALMLKHTSETPLPPSQLLDSLPRAVDAVILPLLEKRPEDRPLELVPVVRDLEKIAAGPELAPRPTPSKRLGIGLAVSAAGLAIVTVGWMMRDKPVAEKAAIAALPVRVDDARPPATTAQSAISAVTVSREQAIVPITSETVRPKSSASAVSSSKRPPATIRTSPGPEDPESPFRGH